MRVEPRTTLFRIGGNSSLKQQSKGALESEGEPALRRCRSWREQLPNVAIAEGKAQVATNTKYDGLFGEMAPRNSTGGFLGIHSPHENMGVGHLQYSPVKAVMSNTVAKE
jgi:hypothetical protein